MIARISPAICLPLLFTLSTASIHADELLLLRNGYVLQGDVSRLGDRYVVKIARGAETRIPVSAVELRCRDFDDAYRQKARMVTASSTSAQRVALIQWCLRHQLNQYASQQVALLASSDPSHPQVAHVKVM